MAPVLVLVASCALIALGLIGCFLCGQGYDETLRRTNAHHIELSYPYGLLEEDVSSVRALSDVQDVEGIYRCYEMCAGSSGSACVRVCSLSERIDTPTLIEGKLPGEANQIVLTSETAELLGLKMGDSLTFDIDKERDAAGMACDAPRFRVESFELVGLVEAPLTMREDDGSYGLAPAAWGSAQGCAWVQAQSFSDVALQEGFSALLIRSAPLAESSFLFPDGGSPDVLLVRALEELGTKRSAARYASLSEEAQNKVNEKAQLLAESKSVMESGVAAINTATTQITNAQSLITSTKALLPTYEAKVATLEAELAKRNEALKKVQDEKKPAFDQAKAEYDKVKAEYDAAVASGVSGNALSEIQQRLQTQKIRYDEAETTYKKAVEEPQKKVDEVNAQLSSARATRDGAYAQIDELNAEIEAADAVRTEETKGFSEDQKDIVQKVNMLERAEQRQQSLSERPWHIVLAREQGLVGAATYGRRMLLSAFAILVPILLMLGLLLLAIARSEKRRQEGSAAEEEEGQEEDSTQDLAWADVPASAVPAPADEDRAAHRGLLFAALAWSVAVLVAGAVVFAGAQHVIGSRDRAEREFGTVVLVDPDVRNADEKLAEVVEPEGMSTIPVMWESMTITLGRGRVAYAQLLATEPDYAHELEGLAFLPGAVDLSESDPYLCKAYESDARANVGDDVLLLDGGGSPLHLRPAGFFESPLGSWQVLMGASAYERAFDEDFEPNAYYLHGSTSHVDELRHTIEAIPGVHATFALAHGKGSVSQTALDVLRAAGLIEALVALCLFVGLCMRALVPKDVEQPDTNRMRTLSWGLVAILGGSLFGLLTGWHALDRAGTGGMRFAWESGVIAAACGFVGALLVAVFVWRKASNKASARAEENGLDANE